MGAWDEGVGILLTASLGPSDNSSPAIEFPVGRRTVSGGRTGAARKYPFRNGQDYEDISQDPRIYNYTVPLFEDVDASHYPSTYLKLIEFIDGDAARGQAELTDPEHGPVPVRMMPWQWETDPMRRNGGVLTMTFETIGDDVTLFRDDAIFTPTAQADISAADLDQQLANAGATPAEMDEAFEAGGAGLTAAEKVAGVGASASRFATLLTRFREEIEVPTDGSDVSATVDLMRRRIELGMSVPSVSSDPVIGWPMLFSGNVLMSAVTDLGQQAFRDAPRVYDHKVERAGTSMYALSVELLGSVSRVGELIQLNPGVPANFVPEGTVIIVPLG